MCAVFPFRLGNFHHERLLVSGRPDKLHGFFPVNAASCIGVLDQLSVIYPNNPGQNVLQFYSETSYGSSGGAVYTQNGIWVGSISGGDTYGTCWAVPYGAILTEFQKCLIELAAQSAGS